MPSHALRLGLWKTWYGRLKNGLTTLAPTCLFGCRSWFGSSVECPKSSLERLPVEILQSISCYLPTSSIACLALCSHRMCYLLGTLTWLALRTQLSEKEEFLHHLEKDLPGHLLCHKCVKFHPRIPKKDLILDLASLCPKSWRDVDLLDSHPIVHLGFRHIQLAMNRQQRRQSLYVGRQSL